MKCDSCDCTIFENIRFHWTGIHDDKILCHDCYMNCEKDDKKSFNAE